MATLPAVLDYERYGPLLLSLGQFCLLGIIAILPLTLVLQNRRDKAAQERLDYTP